MIAAIAPGVFDDLASLDHLDLFSNPITSVDGATLARWAAMMDFECGDGPGYQCTAIAPLCMQMCGDDAICVVADHQYLSSTSTFECQ